MSLSKPEGNTLLSNAIQKRLNSMFARITGFSGPQILDFFSQYSSDVERYPWAGGGPSRWQIFEDSLARFDLDLQKKIIADLIRYDGPMKYGPPSEEDRSYIQTWLDQNPVKDSTPLTAVPHVADKLNWSYVNAEWKKATERIATDPSAAVTTSRALLETVCMHILEARRLEYIWDGDLPKLYRTAASVLNIYPDKQQEDTFKRLLGACTTIINSVAALRNVLGDAHGHGMNVKEAEQRHARLAVNAASTLALFLMETHLAYAE